MIRVMDNPNPSSGLAEIWIAVTKRLFSSGTALSAVGLIHMKISIEKQSLI